MSRLLEQRQSRLGKQRRSNGVDIDVLFDIVDLHSCYSTECFPIGDPRVGDDVVWGGSVVFGLEDFHCGCSVDSGGTRSIDLLRDSSKSFERLLERW